MTTCHITAEINAHLTSVENADRYDAAVEKEIDWLREDYFIRMVSEVDKRTGRLWWCWEVRCLPNKLVCDGDDTDPAKAGAAAAKAMEDALVERAKKSLASSCDD